MNASTSPGSVQIMVLGWRCQVTEPNAVRRISSPVDEAEPPVDEVERRPPQHRPRHLCDGVEVPGSVGRRQQYATGPQHAGELRRRPDGVRGRGTACGSPRPRRRSRRRTGRSCASQVRASASSIRGSAATAPEAAATMPSDRSVRVRRRRGSSGAALTHSSPVPHPTSSTRPPSGHSTRPTSQSNQGTSCPRVPGVQRNARIEVPGVLVLALPQVVAIGAQALPARHEGGGTVLIICKAGWSSPHSSGISSSGRKPQPK